MSDLQTHLDGINTAIANLSPKVDPSVKTALEGIATMLADLKMILTDLSPSAIYTK